MRLTMFVGLMAALLSCGPGKAARSSAATAKPEILSIPFAPPVNTELRYAVTRTKASPEKNSTITLEEVHLFTPATDGYVLTIRTTHLSMENKAFDLTSPAGQQSVPLELRPFLLPVTVDVGRDGSLVRLRDWPRIREAIASLPDMMASLQKTPETQEEMRKIGTNAMAHFLTLTAEQAPAVMLKTWAPLFGYGGAELEAGELYEGTEEAPSPLLPVNLAMTQQLMLSRTEEGHFHYQLQSQPDQKQIAAVTTRFLRQMGEGLTADKRANLEEAVNKMKTMKMENHLDLILNASSGIVEQATVMKLVSIEGIGDGGEETTVTRLN